MSKQQPCSVHYVWRMLSSSSYQLLFVFDRQQQPDRGRDIDLLDLTLLDEGHPGRDELPLEVALGDGAETLTTIPPDDVGQVIEVLPILPLVLRAHEDVHLDRLVLHREVLLHEAALLRRCHEVEVVLRDDYQRVRELVAEEVYVERGGL